MGVPGNPPPPGLAETELFAVDAYRTEFDATVTEVDPGGGRVALARTAFYPVGGGQPSDVGTLQTIEGTFFVTGVRREARHDLAHGRRGDLPDVGTEVQGTIDWTRRHQLMRTHTALHILCGVIWADYGIPVTGGNMEPMKGRLDFPFPAMSADLGAGGRAPDQRGDRAGARDRRRLPAAPRRGQRPRADPYVGQPDPAEIDPLRVIDIVGLDRQADGGTHVLSTAEVGARPRRRAPRARARTTSGSARGRRPRRGSGMSTDHLIGLLLGAEEDWPQRVRGDPAPRRAARRSTARRTPSRQRAAHHRAVPARRPGAHRAGDRPAGHWYYHPREWLKKAALVNGTYLLNSPFTFQSMEKHSAYCAMRAAGPQGAGAPRWCPTRTRSTTSAGPTPREKYNQLLRPRQDRRGAGLPAVHEAVRRRRLARGLADRGPRRPAPRVRRVRRDADAPAGHRRLRALRPRALHRPRDDGDGLPARRSRCTTGTPSPTASSPSRPASRPSPSRRIVNAFFRWEFNSCEMLVGRRRRLPDRLRQRLPGRGGDLAALLLPVGDHRTGALVDVLRGDRAHGQRRPRHRVATSRSPTTSRCPTTRRSSATWPWPTSTSRPSATGSGAPSTSPHLDERGLEWVAGDDFDRLLRDTVQATYPAHEQEEFLAHFRGLVGLWASEQTGLGTGTPG